MNDFIKKQQELALKELDKYWEGPSEDTIREVIQQIITNTGEELMRLAEGERVDEPKDAGHTGVEASIYSYTKGNNQALDTIKQHITSVTGAK